MKVGLSTYSLLGAITSGEFDVLQVIQWIADNHGKHVEIVPSGFTLTDNNKLVSAIVKKAKETGIDISSYTIGANFLTASEEEYHKEIKRVMKEVDIAHALGVKLMRHDVAYRTIEESSLENLDKDLPMLAEACRQIADYAKKYGITTSVENHGRHIQGSERVQRLIRAVGRDNFKTTIDIGNFLCVDENPVCAVKNNIKYASMVHLKDFYLRCERVQPGEGWFPTSGGNHLRGSIFGHGDIDVRAALKVIYDSGYDGYLSLEFEGMEECKTACRMGLDNIYRILKELGCNIEQGIL
ncbi:MAG: sugar phosphate isomerase/epimerase family protein [Victivallales bacterium]|jgi:sugar phosphate isomerase/epimerase